MIEMKRRPVLLLELLTAFILMGGVLALLMSGFSDAIKAKNLMRHEKEKILTRARLQLKFSALMKEMISGVEIEENQYYFRCKGGADPDPAFRSDLDAVLCLREKKLILFTFPELGLPRHELLAENISAIEFKFFDDEKGAFSHIAPKSPRMIKVILNKNKEDETLPIFL